MSSGSSTQTVTQQADPWSGQQPYLLDIFGEAQNLYNTQQPEYFPGGTVAGFDPLETQGQQMALDAATGDITGLSAGATGANQFLTGDVMDPAANEYLAAYAQSAIDPIFQSLTEQALPAVGQGATAAGQYGGSRQGIAEGQAIDSATRAAQDITNQIYSDAYAQNLEAMQRGVALAPQTAQMALMPAQTVSGVGAQQREYDQAMINDAIARWEFEQSAPWDALAMYQGLVQGNFGGTGTSTASQNVSPVDQALSAAMTGMGTYGMMSAIPAMGPYAPIAAGTMALASLF